MGRTNLARIQATRLEHRHDACMQLTQSRTETRQAHGGNGGFPEPPRGAAVRVISLTHPACGTETRILLPSGVPDDVIRRVVCDGCRQTFEVGADCFSPTPAIAPYTAADVTTSAPSRAGGPIDAVRGFGLAIWDWLLDGADAVRGRLPSTPDISRNRLWAWASLPLAALGVIAGLALIQGSSDPAPPAPAAPAAVTGAADAKFIQETGYSLALPPGFKRADPPDGASFRAEAKSGNADATLWIERAPNLSFKEFEKRSLEQLSGLAGNARVVDRVDGPTLETSIVELRADAPVADGATATYRVTLRAAGDFRLYFATVTQPGAEPDLLSGVGLMHGSLRPEVKLKGEGEGS